MNLDNSTNYIKWENAIKWIKDKQYDSYLYHDTVYLLQGFTILKGPFIINIKLNVPLFYILPSYPLVLTFANPSSTIYFINGLPMVYQ